MKKIFLFLTVIAYSITTQAQKETANWTFGQNGGFTWNTTQSLSATAVPGTGTLNKVLDGLPTTFKSSLSTLEGCFTISDNTGQLLFYSDGIKVYNKNHTIMPNGSGLLGDSDSVQSGIIFPYPQSSTQYVALSAAAWFTTLKRINYSIVDITRDGGLGDVTTKNTPLPGDDGYYETVTATRHQNGVDYWVLAPNFTAQSISAWKFTSSGVSNPVQSPFPNTDPRMSTASAGGYLKITPDGKHFVMPSYSLTLLFVGDFDNSTGVCSNIRTLSIGGGGYGLEFSPDQKTVLLAPSYQDVVIAYKASELFSFSDLTKVTKKTYSVSGYGGVWGLQLAPDKRIYGSFYQSTSNMLVIDNLSQYDQLKFYTVPLLNKAGSPAVQLESKMGFPSFAASWFNMESLKIQAFACAEYGFKFSMSITQFGTDTPVKLVWDFGDGTTEEQPIIAGQTDYTIVHPYASAGQYNVILTPVKADNINLDPSNATARIIDCDLKSNRMIRIDLQNKSIK